MVRATIALVALLGCGDDGTPPVDGGSQAVVVPAGTFGMGCADSQGCLPDELPYHQLMISAFEIERTEVTQAAYQQCIAAGACTAPQANFDPAMTAHQPVRDVSWLQAQAYCAWRGMRLPTEAEWEKAARGDDARNFPWGSGSPDCACANFAGCGGAPLDVGVRECGAGPYGTLDSAGNLSEWVADWYAANYYSASPVIDPQGPTDGSMRVARGGSYLSESGALRVTRRVVGEPNTAYDAYGFRCVRSLP
jgi:formylglycine-generating enzyme required for sulfatase activity